MVRSATAKGLRIKKNNKTKQKKQNKKKKH
jgi:hypothetical protein